MKTIRISDMTMKQAAEGFQLSFKEKIELAKLLDKLGVSVIELEGMTGSRIDSLRIKSIAAAVESSTVAVPVTLDKENVQLVWAALQQAKHPRLQVCAAVSSVQMEYLFHKKPDAMLAAIADTIASCKALCDDVEFIADDATRADAVFLAKALSAAIEAGATTVTVCDTAGTMLPSEFAAFVKALDIPDRVSLGICCANELSMADGCAVAAVGEGAGELKAAAYPLGTASLANLAKLLAARGDSFGATCTVQTTQLSRIIDRITQICLSGKSKTSALANAQGDTGIYLTAHDDITAVTKVAEQLGYDLSEEDSVKVFDAFQRIVAKREQVSSKELDAIIASAAMQVPPTYKLDAFVITSGNTISATAHIKLLKNDVPMEGVSIGDGPIDAAFVAIENITGCHYELDDFQLQAVTEGREAMGQTVVKLRDHGKVYSGRGISTDIVGAGIHAYLSALNKIVYEEEMA